MQGKGKRGKGKEGNTKGTGSYLEPERFLEHRTRADSRECGYRHLAWISRETRDKILNKNQERRYQYAFVQNISNVGKSWIEALIYQR